MPRAAYVATLSLFLPSMAASARYDAPSALEMYAFARSLLDDNHPAATCRRQMASAGMRRRRRRLAHSTTKRRLSSPSWQSRTTLSRRRFDSPMACSIRTPSTFGHRFACHAPRRADCHGTCSCGLQPTPVIHRERLLARGTFGYLSAWPLHIRSIRVHSSDPTVFAAGGILSRSIPVTRPASVRAGRRRQSLPAPQSDRTARPTGRGTGEGRRRRRAGRLCRRAARCWRGGWRKRTGCAAWSHPGALGA
jgi:hypothetical protein